MNTSKKVRYLTTAAIIAALYTALTLISSALGLANMPIQLRLSEALCALPILTPAAIPGLFVGCFLSNVLSGCPVPDIVFGSLATLIGAFGTYLLRSKKILALLPPVISNAAIIPFVLAYAYNIEGSIPFFMLTIALSEIVSCGVLGYMLLRFLPEKLKISTK